jgi:hypothetical protein
VIGIPFDIDHTGVIDFERCRYRLEDSEPPVLADGGRTYALFPDGRWRPPSPGAGSQPLPGQPLWVLQLLRGAVAVEPAEHGGLRVLTDIVLADERSALGVRMAPDQVLRDARVQPIVLSLEHGLIRRATLLLPVGEHSIELSDFGGPPSIELPPDDLIADPE